MKISNMTKNTVISALFALLFRGAGLLFNVYLTGKIGAEGIGLLTVIGSIYGLGITFSAAGYKLATTRLAVIDESEGEPNPSGLLTKIMSLALITGALAFCILYFGAGFIARKILCDMRCERALKILAFSLPIMAQTGVLTAYLGAFLKVVKVSLIQAISQTVQIAYLVIAIGSETNCEKVCIKLALGDTYGEGVAFILALIFVSYEISKKKCVNCKKHVYGPFLKIAIPDALGYELRSVLSTVQHLLIPIGFRKMGSSSSYALSVYGIMHGMALQVILFPSFILRSLAGLLVPTVTEYHSLNNSYLIKNTVRRVIHMTVVFSALCASVMYFGSGNISSTLYGENDCSGAIRLFAPLIPVMYLDICVDSMLKGLDLQVASMCYNLLDSFLSVVLLFFLIPKYGIKGYVITVFITEIMNTFLSLGKLLRESEVSVHIFEDIVSPLICAIISGLFAKALITHYGVFTLVLQIIVNIIAFAILNTAMSKETRNNIFAMLSIKKYENT